MSITEKQYNNLQFFSEQQQSVVTYDSEGIDFAHDDANVSLQDWSGRGNFFVSFDVSTGSEKYNKEVEIDIVWANIAKLSRDQWSKENKY
jgi:hypothetical protein